MRGSLATFHRGTPQKEEEESQQGVVEDIVLGGIGGQKRSVNLSMGQARGGRLNGKRKK